MAGPESPTGSPFKVGQVVDGYRWTGREWERVHGIYGRPAPEQNRELPSPPDVGGLRLPFWIPYTVIMLSISASAYFLVPRPEFAAAPAASPSVAAACTPDGTRPTPSSSTSADPEAAARDLFAVQFGSFAPISQSYSQDSRIRLPDAAAAGIVTADFSGSGLFSLQGYNPRDEPLDPFEFSTGPWHGTVLYGQYRWTRQVDTVEVNGREPWTVKIAPICTAPRLRVPATGSGPAVFFYPGGRGTWTVSYDGTRPFRIRTYDSDGRFTDGFSRGGEYQEGEDLRKTTQYRGRMRAPGLPMIVEIVGDGDWTIDAE